MISTNAIKSLRDQTGIPIGECKKALEEAGGDETKALDVLRARGVAVAEKKSGRSLGAGHVSAYVHGSTTGVLVVLSSETDFVAKNPEFIALADDLSLQVAAMNPTNVEELTTQPFIKNPAVTVADEIRRAVQKFGERIEVSRFVRLEAND